MSDAWLNAFGDALNIGVDVPTAVVGNGLGNSVGGAAAVGDQSAGASGHYNGFGEVNVAVDVPTVVSGNGVGNAIGGGVLALGGQDVGDHGLSATTPFGEVNVGVVTPTAVAANGVGNLIGGSVDGSGLQTVGDPAAHHL
ncbi:MAG: hypothetical protein JO107_12645 [Hyphomicrobiales bacterium]|nr:hypothetical protein [Hyphomicrobiales bacterium]